MKIKLSEYRLVREPRPEVLQATVCRLLSEGWVCQGGIATAPTNTGAMFLQAMTLTREVECDDAAMEMK